MPYRSLYKTTKEARQAAQLLKDAFGDLGHEAGRKAAASLAIPGAEPVDPSAPVDLAEEVARLQAQHYLMAIAMERQSNAYKDVIKAHSNLLQMHKVLQDRFDRMERLVTRWAPDKSSQGEIREYILGCKAAEELTKERRRDRDDDPEADKDGASEPTGPSTTGEPARAQGESMAAGGEAGRSGEGGSGTGATEAGTKTT